MANEVELDSGDQETIMKCSCICADPHTLPKPKSKQAIKLSDAGKSYNCGEDCLNRWVTQQQQQQQWHNKAVINNLHIYHRLIVFSM